MNNSLTLPEQSSTPPEWLRVRETELVKIIEALSVVAASAEWSSLKSLLFDGVVEKLEKQLLLAASEKPVKPEALYDLQGQVVWAKRYADLQALSERFRTELKSVRAKLTPPTERATAPDTI